MPALTVRKTAHYGFRRSLPRPEALANIGELKIQTQVDPRDVLAKILNNQWALGSCTSNAVEECVRYDAILDGHDPGQLSRFQLYWGERKIEGLLGQGDTGAEGHDGFVVARHGLAPESAWPYTWPGMEEGQTPDDSVFDPAQLPAEVTKQSGHYKLTKQVAAVPQSVHAIKKVLSNRQTTAFGFTVYDSFESDTVANTGVVPMPGPDEQAIGGHETLICGYLKSEPHYALVMNSWGEGWGLKGFFLMPWAYIIDPQLSSDLRTIVRPLGK